MQVTKSIEPTGHNFAFYQGICEQLHNLLGNERNMTANAANTAALVKDCLPHVNWVGFYFTEEAELVLGPFQGKTAAMRIPFAKGICGRAAVEQRTVIVSEGGKSEIAVPLLNWGKLRGVFYLTSNAPDCFEADDEEGLESIASVFMSSLVSDDMPDLSEEAAWG